MIIEASNDSAFFALALFVIGSATAAFTLNRPHQGERKDNNDAEQCRL